MKRKNENYDDNVYKKMRIEENHKRKFEENDFYPNKKQKLEILYKEQSTQTDLDNEKIELYQENLLLKEILKNLNNEYQNIKNSYENRMRRIDFFQTAY